jgi:hypothetical protein
MDLETKDQLTIVKERIKKLEKNTQLNYEALKTIRKILDVQSQRLDNLEDFLHKITGGNPPNGGKATTQ